MSKSKKVKTIDVAAKEWFDKINGNSYFSAQIILNYKMAGEKTFKLPIQYGYSDSYRDAALTMLIKENILPLEKNYRSLSKYCDENNIILRATKHKNCLKMAVTVWGA